MADDDDLIFSLRNVEDVDLNLSDYHGLTPLAYAAFSFPWNYFLVPAEVLLFFFRQRLSNYN